MKHIAAQFARLFLLATLIVASAGLTSSQVSAAPMAVLSNLTLQTPTGGFHFDSAAFGFTTPAVGLYAATSAKFDLVPIWSPCTFSAWIYSDNGGTPGTSLAAFTPIVPSEWTEYELTLTQPYLLSPSTTYWVVTESSNCTPGAFGSTIPVGYSVSNVIPTGIFTYAGMLYKYPMASPWTYPQEIFEWALFAEEVAVPEVSLDTTAIDFGSQLVGATTAAQTVTLTNTGGGDLHIGLVSFTSDWILSNDTCSNATVTPGNSCSIDIAFHPLALGTLTGEIAINSDAASTPDVITLSGVGLAVPEGYNLLSKPDFAGAYAKFPYPWQAQGITRPYASALDCNVFLSPSCSVKLTGERTYKALAQTITRSGHAGDIYQFGLSSRAQNVPAGGKYLVEVLFYRSPTRPFATYTLTFTPGTHDWQTLSDIVTAPGDYTRIVFRFAYQNTGGGTTWFDDAFLIAQPPIQ